MITSTITITITSTREIYESTVGDLGGVIRTLGEDNRVLRDHAIRVEDGRIRRTAPAAEVDAAGARVIDAAGKAVLPGWINAHMHFYSTLVRGLGKAKPSRDFVEQPCNLWWRPDCQPPWTTPT